MSKIFHCFYLSANVWITHILCCNLWNMIRQVRRYISGYRCSQHPHAFPSNGIMVCDFYYIHPCNVIPHCLGVTFQLQLYKSCLLASSSVLHSVLLVLKHVLLTAAICYYSEPSLPAAVCVVEPLYEQLQFLFFHASSIGSLT